MIDILRKLMQLDDEETRLSLRMEPYRARLAAMARSSAVTGARLAVVSSDVQARSKIMRSLEADLKCVEEKKKSEQKKLDAVASLKAAQALEHEIEAVTKNVSALEDQILDQMECLESADKELDALKVEADRTQAEIDTLQSEISGCEQEIRARQALLTVEIAEAVSQLPPDMQKKWNALKASRIAHPVALVDSNACARCRSELKPNAVAKLHAGQSVSCDQCKRILLPV